MSSDDPAGSLFGPPGEAPDGSRGHGVEPAAPEEELQRLARALPATIFLGTSSWSFPGWQRIVYGGEYTEVQLARTGLAAYARHPLLHAVGIDRGFYRPLSQQQYEAYARQVPERFRFVVKAPSVITDASLRGERGQPAADNASFLDPSIAREKFVLPALRGLGPRAGPLVFQLSPLPRPLVADSGRELIDNLGLFLRQLPREVDGRAPVYAVELRNAELLTPRFVRMLHDAGVRLCLGIHAAMPAAARQAAALRALDSPAGDEGENWTLKGPLVVRWSLRAGLRYEQARNRYAPFDRLLDADLITRGTLAHLAHVAIRSSQPAYVIVNNKAEGSAPLSCIELARAIVGR
jgi:uncharacterized protein YecE (DUF72 family)